MLRYIGTPLAALCVAAAPASAESLHLVCIGGGSATKPTFSSARASDSDGNLTSATITGSRSFGFEDQVDVEIDGSTGRIRLPRVMLPPMHGGANGWFELKVVSITDRTIDGSAKVNFINLPKVHVDRMTGRISISGSSGSFGGECRPYDPSTQVRKF